MENNLKKEYIYIYIIYIEHIYDISIYVCIYLNHVAIYVNLTQHCKLITLQNTA